MTNRKQALEQLRDKVKADETNEMVARRSIELWWLHSKEMHHVNGAYNGSLDAALALHEAVLPDWAWQVPHTNNFHLYRHDLTQHSCGYNKNPARAWLLAILEALIAQEGE